MSLPAPAAQSPLYRTTAEWAAYHAEWATPSPREFNDHGEVEEFVQEVVSSAAWREMFSHMVSVRAISLDEDVVDAATGIRSKESWSELDRPLLASSGVVQIHPEMRHGLNVLHELAHLAAPRHAGGADRQRQLAGHSVEFAATLLYLVDHFGSLPDHGAQMAAMFAIYRVAIPTIDELVAAIRDSRETEAVIEAQQAEMAELEAAALGSREGVQPRGFIPTWPWGGDLWWMRKRLKMSQRSAAEAVSRIERCRAADVGRIERLETVPGRGDERLRRLALYLAVLYGMDPIYLRHIKHLGVEAGVLMRDLERLNRSWVQQLRWINRTLRTHPPRWWSNTTQ